SAASMSSPEKASPRQTRTPSASSGPASVPGRSMATTGSPRARISRARWKPTPVRAPKITVTVMSGRFRLPGQPGFQLLEALDLIGLQRPVLVAADEDLEHRAAFLVEELDRHRFLAHERAAQEVDRLAVAGAQVAADGAVAVQVVEAVAELAGRHLALDL